MHLNGIHRWIRLGFIAWAVLSTLWLANSFRTQGVDPALLESGGQVTVARYGNVLHFSPTGDNLGAGLVFLCGGGVAPEAYAPLLRPLAEAGHHVLVVGLPWRLAPLDSHRQTAMRTAAALPGEHPDVPAWVVAGHSLGGALAVQVAAAGLYDFAGLALIGTTHPKERDYSGLSLPVTKIYASADGLAPVGRVLANKPLLPAHTRWVAIEGGNHSQFGHYGRQLFDGDASISRDAQQAATRIALLDLLGRAVD